MKTAVFAARAAPFLKSLSARGTESAAGGGGYLSVLLLDEVIDAISRLGMLPVNASDLDLETGPQ